MIHMYENNKIHMLTKKVKYEGKIHLIFVFDDDV